MTSSRKFSKLESTDMLQIIQLIQKGSPEVIPMIKSIQNFNKYLVSEVKFKQNQWNLLHLASWYGNSQLCTELIKLGLDTDSVDKVRDSQHNETPLHLAACRGHYKTVEALLPTSEAKGLKNIVRITQKGQTPVDLALTGGHCKVAKLIESNMQNQLDISDLV